MQGKLNWPNLVSKNRAQKVTWKTWRANLETLGFRRYLGFSPKTWPTNSSVWRNLTAAAAPALHSLRELQPLRTNDAVQYLSTVWEWRAHAAAAVKFLHTLLLVGHVLGENPRYLLNPRVSRFALRVFQVTFCARFFDTKFGQFNFPCIGPIVVSLAVHFHEMSWRLTVGMKVLTAMWSIRGRSPREWNRPRFQIIPLRILL
jgi:hypothetical protein